MLEALGPEGYLVNMARGTLVDEAAMVEMLQHRAARRRGARCVREGAECAARRCSALDNVVLSPHQGSATQQTRDKMGALVVANLDAHFAGEPLPSAVV